MLVPTAAQADPSFYESPLFGLTVGPGNTLLVADAGQGIVNSAGGALIAPLPGVTDVAARSGGGLWATTGAGRDPTEDTGQGIWRVSGGTPTLVANLFEYEEKFNPHATAVDSNPFDVADAGGGNAVVADAGGNSLLLVGDSNNPNSNVASRVKLIATFPDELVSTAHAKSLFGCPAGPLDICGLPAMIPAQPVPTSVAIGPDGAYYVGELKGFPAPLGESRVWRIEPGTRNARCGESSKCRVVLDGLTSIIDLAFGPGGALSVAQIDDAGWLAMELGQGADGSGPVCACNLTSTGACSTFPPKVPMLTAIAWRVEPALGLTLLGDLVCARTGAGQRRSLDGPVAVDQAGAGSRARPCTAWLSLPRAEEGHAHRARLRRALARPRALARRAADDLGAHGARLVRATYVRDPPDHRARVVLHDVLEDARRPRRLRVPQPLGSHVRRRLHRHVDRDQGATAVGLRHSCRRFVDRPLGARLLPAAAAQRGHGRVLLTPSLESKYTYPAALKDEIADVVGEYLFDTKDFRTDDKEYLLRQVYEMTDRRFALAEHLLATKPWSLFAMVEMGPDRMHHGFWKYMDPEHRKHEPGNAYESAILDYHRHVDGLIGKLLEHADEDTVVFVLSDHGAKRLDGRIRIDVGLRSEGLLATLRVAERRVFAARRRGRLSRRRRGGRRVLRARLPQRRGARARGDDRGGAVRAVRDDLAPRTRNPDDAGDPIPTAGSSRRSSTATRRASPPT